MKKFASWCIQSYGWWWRFELSWLATTYIGSIQTKNAKVQRWSEPVYRAYCAGLWILHWTQDTVYWVAKPVVRTELVGGRKRLHHPTKPALESDCEDLFFWHGVLVPAEWILTKSITPQAALTWPNIEQRRAACEILGWGNIMGQLDARLIDKNESAYIGTLWEANIPDSGPEKFLQVKCGTGRENIFLPVARDLTTALSANAWLWGSNGVDQSIIQQLGDNRT